MYTHFCLPDSPNPYERMVEYAGEEFNVPLKVILGFKKVNLFLGSNNSGKSKFLRSTFSDAFNGSFFSIDEEFIRTKGRKYFLGAVEQLENFFNHTSFYKGATINNQNYSRFVLIFLENYYSGRTFKKINGHEIYEALNRTFEKFFNAEIRSVTNKKQATNIPMLRGLNSLQNVNERPSDIYKSATVTQYFSNNSAAEQNIHTGQTIYNDLVSMLLGEKKDREKVSEFQDFLKDKVFNGKDITLIPKVKSEVVWVKIGDEDEKAIFDLGDGIQQLIIMLFPVFMHMDEEHLFFIEEPENSMHPGMQRIFLETLLKYSGEKHQFFLTTHSNHLADMIYENDDMSIFMFKKKRLEADDEYNPRFSITHTDCKDIEILNELGVNNTSVFMANCTIWVEGITDRKYIREYLKKYQNEKNGGEVYFENLHYSFVEYGGSNIAHLGTGVDEANIDIDRVSNRALVIADFDEEKESTHNARKKALREGYFYIKGLKEIENSLHENILKKVIAKFEKLGEEALVLKDEENFIQGKYRGQNIGKVIEKHLEGEQKYKAGYVSGNTIKPKDTFCKYACKFLSEEKDYAQSMSADAILLAERVFSFIKEHNQDELML